MRCSRPLLGQGWWRLFGYLCSLFGYQGDKEVAVVSLLVALAWPERSVGVPMVDAGGPDTFAVRGMAPPFAVRQHAVFGRAIEARH